MTAAELVAAVQPCLPLPGIDSQGRIDDNDELGNSSRIVKGAIADACAERGWCIHAMHGPTPYIGINWPDADGVMRHNHTEDGDDAIAWCKAYVAARKCGAA